MWEMSYICKKEQTVPLALYKNRKLKVHLLRWNPEPERYWRWLVALTTSEVNSTGQLRRDGSLAQLSSRSSTRQRLRMAILQPQSITMPPLCSTMMRWKASGGRKTTVAGFLVQQDYERLWLSLETWFRCVCYAKSVYRLLLTIHGALDSSRLICHQICLWHWVMHRLPQWS